MPDFQRKCPLCSGEMLRSRSVNTSYFWKKPWKNGLFDWGAERVYPWACMSCGVVLLYLERLPALVGEYKKAREKEPAPQIAPAPLKS
ncbi:MAG TPA: hypothetical protein VEO37_08635 [Thermoanaerobaculia bacterium]|nr:hypothetical protein [Thermoanaerobaculia bacterium]